MNEIEEHLRKPGVMADLTADLMAGKALRLVIDERARQVAYEGYTPAHDDEREEGRLALLAAAYALSSRQEGEEGFLDAGLEFYDFPFKPKDPIRDLVRAGALILAELERWLRSQDQVSEPKRSTEAYIAHLQRRIQKLEAENAAQKGSIQALNGYIVSLEEQLRKSKGLPTKDTRLSRWQGHKIVGADKIVAAVNESPSMHGHWDLLCGGSIRVSLQLARRVPDGVSPVGGYYVRYNDNFESWSPRETFEKGYTRLPT